jgi:hypothetical protein
VKFSLSPETKKYLIVGASAVAAVIVGVYLYQRYQVNTSQGQSDEAQAQQDELEFLAEQAAGGASEYDLGGGGTTAFTLPTSATGQTSLAGEITSLEQALGLTPPTSASGGSSSGAGSSAGSSGSSGGATTSTPPTPRTVVPPGANPKIITAPTGEASELPVLEMDSDRFL